MKTPTKKAKRVRPKLYIPQTSPATNQHELHDFFAGCALCGIMASLTVSFSFENNQQAAEAAWKLADAMISARQGHLHLEGGIRHG